MIDLIGFLLPPLIDLVNRKVSDKDARFWISVVICSIVGILLEFVKNSGAFVSLDATIASMFVVFGMAQISYKAVWEENRVREKLDLRATDNAPKVELPEIK